MAFSRRSILQGLGGALALPALESTVHAEATKGGGSSSNGQTPLRFLVVGNPLGMHPPNFFPQDFGRDYTISRTLQPLEWAKDRFTIFSHTDHGMKSGHGRELAFLSGVLPETSHAFAEKNMSIDQLIAKHIGGDVRYPSIHASLQTGIRMVWNANGVELEPFTDPQKLFDYLFLNLSDEEKKTQRQTLARNRSILDAVAEQFAGVKAKTGAADRERLDQFGTSIRELEDRMETRRNWVDRDKPQFDISHHFEGEATIINRYNAIFDMVAYAFQTDLTRVATVAFPNELGYTDVNGVNRGYHACTHNGKDEQVVAELVAIESFQIEQLSRFMKKLDDVDEPNANGSMLDHTVILFGSGMGYGGTHSNRNLPILVAGGGFKHLGHVDTRNAAGNNMPLCNLYVTLMQRFGIERDRFNLSTGAFELSYA
ncbi:DUF1552 domain-containing protein [Aporhodopirellula aestuarii]|uniref:DUF1552 domain-containing protein n=1 Tax=Aporhodopirellula aestuarii TaxID=2950107 RepID=A0ABT0TYP9_9BACT|nr:DUF1552 domain-containing protein [Aporhodopirellula aestuarii]MCM2369721.1 DUF1552 domain-containing protein [Aporhodopirellula aestuarii]